MIGQKQFSLKDKHAGRSPDDVRVPESPKTLKHRLALTSGKKKKNGVVRRATAAIIKNVKGK